METQFAFEVFVNGKPLKEYDLLDDTYIEADLHTDTSYIIKDVDDEGYTQNYPVTPFEVRGWFRNTLKTPCYLKLCVDGQQIWMKPFPPSYDGHKNRFSVNGIKDIKRGSVKELLFSLPKITSQKDKSSENWTKHLGTITLECLEAVEDGYFQTRRREFKQVRQPTIISDKTTHHQATKQDCSRTGGIGVATREGRGISTFGLTKNVITMMRYKLGKQSFGVLTLKYRTRHVLQELGIIDKKWVDADSDISAQCKKEKINTEKQKEKSSAEQKKTEVKEGEKENTAPAVKKAEIEATKLSMKTNKKAKAFKDDIGKNGDGDNVLAEHVINKTIKKELIDDNNEKKGEETGCIKSRLRSARNVDKSAVQTGAIKKESMAAEEKYQERVDSVISQLRDLGCRESKKLFCYSPSLKIKKEIMENGKLGCHSQSGVSQSLFNEKLGCHTPSDKSGHKFMDLRQIKQEMIDDEDKQVRYIEIDDDLIMLEEVDDDVIWMGDDSCCFVEVEPENVPIINIA